MFEIGALFTRDYIQDKGIFHVTKLQFDPSSDV
jgi:hypothetical protein